MSSALCLIGMLLFAITGITLNHSAQIKTTPVVVKQEAMLPAELRQQLQAQVETGGRLPPALRAWLAAQWSLRGAGAEAEWAEDEVYLSLPRPGGDGWLNVELETGRVTYERTDRGWVAYLNDLHKARNTGAVWSGFVDVFALACLVFSVTGLLLLLLHSARRRSTWPLVGLGLLLPLLLALLFIH